MADLADDLEDDTDLESDEETKESMRARDAAETANALAEDDGAAAESTERYITQKTFCNATSLTS